MGPFYVDCEVTDIRNPAKTMNIAKLRVDSGSEYTWIHEADLEKIGMRVAKKDVAFVRANGQMIVRSIGYGLLRAAGFKTVDEVVFAQSEDQALLGWRTLEGFGAVVDPARKMLIAAGPRPATMTAIKAKSQ
jgi:predicted aspartyl protease